MMKIVSTHQLPANSFSLFLTTHEHVKALSHVIRMGTSVSNANNQLHCLLNNYKGLPVNSEHSLQLSSQLLALVDGLDGITNKLINESLCGLLLVDSGGSLTHQEWAGVVHGLIIDIITELLKVVLDWDYALRGQLLDLLCAVLLPVVDIVVLADAHWATSEDNGADVVVEASSADGFLVGLGCTSLLCENETGSDPDGGGTESKSSCNGLSVVYTASGNDLDVLASHWGLLALAELDNGWDENSGWGISGVSTSLATLGADHINTEVEALLNMLWVSDHVHVENTVGVELVDNSLWWDTDGGNEKFSTRLDNNIDELIELALGVIVATKRVSSAQMRM